MDKIILHELSFYYGYLPNIDNKKLITHILKKGVLGSPDETDSIHEDLYFPSHKEYEKILQGINKYFIKAHGYVLQPTRFWSQIHLPNQSTNTHNHLDVENMSQGPAYSGVYYLQCDARSGYFCFQYKKDGVTFSRWKIKPEVGKFILFPPYLEHFVTRNYSNERRISISFNFNTERCN